MKEQLDGEAEEFSTFFGQGGGGGVGFCLSLSTFYLFIFCSFLYDHFFSFVIKFIFKSPSGTLRGNIASLTPFSPSVWRGF